MLQEVHVFPFLAGRYPETERFDGNLSCCKIEKTQLTSHLHRPRNSEPLQQRAVYISLEYLIPKVGVFPVILFPPTPSFFLRYKGQNVINVYPTPALATLEKLRGGLFTVVLLYALESGCQQLGSFSCVGCASLPFKMSQLICFAFHFLISFF